MPFTAGEILTADNLNSWVVPISAAKSTGTSRNTTVTRTADPHLTIALPASTTWDFELMLIVSSAADAAGDFAYELAFPAGATVSCGGMALDITLATSVIDNLNAGAATSVDTTSPTAAQAAGASTTPTVCMVWGRIVLAGTAGNLVLNWAQQASNANNTTLNAGSKLVARRAA